MKVSDWCHFVGFVISCQNMKIELFVGQKIYMLILDCILQGCHLSGIPENVGI